MQRAKKLKAPIVVAKLDRLSRGLPFIHVDDKKVGFVAADDPTNRPSSCISKAGFVASADSLIRANAPRMLLRRPRSAACGWETFGNR
jgi:hypothetical protein